MMPIAKNIKTIIGKGWVITEISLSPDEREWRGKAECIAICPLRDDDRLVRVVATDPPHLFTCMRREVDRRMKSVGAK